ncbi:TadE family type IV pilus minor pilin [Leifsonia shinshuensis]|uniref:Pilus assembly protein n=1 Tax=Leifsonia shinshuensis TaxID=150026 RepID=A0A853D2C1_9MICO|nr:TadE family type IV pilus minor pilin [Leifsonia shinshuensis]NYJ25170.1 hypothetical protein [Leifsonia shinshuensis]
MADVARPSRRPAERPRSAGGGGPLRALRERGSVTAEFAAALPAVLLCLALCVGAIQASAQQARLLDHAASAARLLGRGDTAPGPPDGATRSVGTEGGLLCVTVTAPSRAGGIGALGLTVSARSCALDDSEPG